MINRMVKAGYFLQAPGIFNRLITHLAPGGPQALRPSLIHPVAPTHLALMSRGSTNSSGLATGPPCLWARYRLLYK